MSECVICFENITEEIKSICNHGPYCYHCYNNITSPLNPKCPFCKLDILRSNNPNPRYVDENIVVILNRYEITEVISNGYNIFNNDNIQYENNQENTSNEDDDYESGFRTPPNGITINPNELRQCAITRGLKYKN